MRDLNPRPIAYEAIALPAELMRLPDPTMALLVLLLSRELVGFASHSRGDPLITNDVLYQLSYTGVPARLLARITDEG